MPEERKSEKLDLTSPPIVEVVVDIDCDLPTDFDLAGTEAAAVEGLADSYHWVGRRSTRAGKTTGGEGGVDSLNSDRLQFRSGDGKQVVQFRAGGFSFNRLAPYSSFDDYLPEIQRLWAIFVNISKPVGLRRIRLRTVNRIWLPIDAHSGVSLDKYIETGPKLPELPGRSPCLVGFFDQHQLFDASTGSDATIIITAQEAQENRLPLILDIDVYSNDVPDISEWAGIGSVLQSLRSLKNDIFKATLTPSCLSLFSDPPSVR